MRIDGAAQLAVTSLGNSKLQEAERIELISTLGEVLPPQAKPALVKVLNGQSTDKVKAAAIGALRGYSADEGVVSHLIECVKSGSPSLREAAIEYLSGNRNAALGFLRIVAAGDIPRSAVTPVMAEKMKLYRDDEIDRLIKGISVKAGEGINKVEIKRLQKLITEAPGNPKRGEKVFVQRCGSCHLMFGKGGVIGPDLTSYQKGDEQTLLMSIVSPSVEIREGFEHVVIMTRKGDVYSGFRTEENDNAVFLRELSGAARSISKKEIKSTAYSPVSLMPEGLLDGLQERELQDLFAYLRSTTPPF
jgi:putative heme-binding domain-containing protein